MTQLDKDVCEVDSNHSCNQEINLFISNINLFLVY